MHGRFGLIPFRSPLLREFEIPKSLDSISVRIRIRRLKRSKRVYERFKYFFVFFSSRY